MPEGALFYARPSAAARSAIDAALRRVQETIAAVRAMLAPSTLPPPLQGEPAAAATLQALPLRERCQPEAAASSALQQARASLSLMRGVGSTRDAPEAP